ncbi:hypothetical protein VTI74DRAFT_8380 [Chaetomium olivicolor]
MPSATPPQQQQQQQQQQPQLQKKTSIRDRLKVRGWQKPPQPLEIPIEEKPRFVYEPKHAAADFSRLAVSPLSPTRHHLPLSPPAEDTAAARHNSQRRQRHSYEPRASHDEDPASARHHRHSTRHSYTPINDPFQAAAAAAHVPINARPVAWAPGVEPAARKEAQQEQQQQQQQQQQQGQQMSDYELFIARAEAEDRARREQARRIISQRSAAAFDAARVRPDPHRQFAAAAGSGGGGGRSSADSSDDTQKRNSGRYVLRGGDQQQQQQQQRREWSRKHGHVRGAGWVAGDETRANERLLQQQPRAQPRRMPEPQPIVLGVDDEFNRAGGRNQTQPARMLRRQASLTQRIVQYIRPPKAGVTIETLAE